MTDFRMVRGDSKKLDVAITRLNPSTGLDDPVTPQKVWFTVKRSKNDLDVDAIVSINSEDDPLDVLITSGSVRITLYPANTTDYKQRWLLYDVQIREVDGTITTVEHGAIELVDEITLSTV